MTFDPGQDYSSDFHQNTVAEATAAAEAAYKEGLLSNQREDLAFRKAQQAWKEVMDKAGLTGMYEGQYTMPVQQWQAETFGTWGAPQQGQQTLGGQQQQWQQAYQTAAQYGQYYGPGQGPAVGTKTQQQIEQEFTQGLRTQQEQRAAQNQRQTQTQAYLQLLSQLRGPADWAKYQQVLGSTPGGMRDLYAAAMGQYVPGGGATTGYQPEAASLQSMMGQIGGIPYNPAAAGQPLNMANVYQGGQGSYGQQQQAGGAMTMEWNPQVQQRMFQGGQQQPGQNSLAVMPGTPQEQALQEQQRWQKTQNAGMLSPAAQQFQIEYHNPQAQQQAQNAYAVQAQGGGTNMMGANQPQAGQPGLGQAPQQPRLPAPNQIAPQSWANLAPSQREMMLGDYEAAGWHKPDVEALFAQSLPKYGANAPTAGTFRLR